jgi:hypothetical protein
VRSNGRWWAASSVGKTCHQGDQPILARGRAEAQVAFVKRALASRTSKYRASTLPYSKPQQTLVLSKTAGLGMMPPHRKKSDPYLRLAPVKPIICFPPHSPWWTTWYVRDKSPAATLGAKGRSATAQGRCEHLPSDWLRSFHYDAEAENPYTRLLRIPLVFSLAVRL